MEQKKTKRQMSFVYTEKNNVVVKIVAQLIRFYQAFTQDKKMKYVTKPERL